MELRSPNSISTPLSLQIDDSAALHVDAGAWSLDAAAWRGFVSLLLGPILTSATPHEGANLDKLFEIYEQLGFETVFWGRISVTRAE